MMYSVALPSSVHEQAIEHLLRQDGQEDLCFALWHPSQGRDRITALIHSLILPLEGDRDVHGNVSFMPSYFERALSEAINAGAGLAFMHSHPASGWQDMSLDDIHAEQRLAAAVKSATELPLVGLTIGTDEAWSARFWTKTAPRTYERQWCDSVRVVGSKFAITLHPNLAKKSVFRPELERTILAWGKEAQSQLANLTVGIVGAGSVGSIVAEALARMGIGHIRLLDFDSVEKVNLDRLLFATRRDALLKKSKVEVIAKAIRQTATAGQFTVEPLEWSIVEESGFQVALDCDVLFSCVDRPLARSVLNFIAYAHLIPVVDGGIMVRVNERTQKLKHADWRTHIAIPDRPCLECLEQYDPGQVSSERDGFLDDPAYIAGLPHAHWAKRNENVFAFSLSVASFEVLQFLSLIVAPSGINNPRAQMYHFITAGLDKNDLDACKSRCLYPGYTARGDHAGISVTSHHLAAEKEREKRQAYHRTLEYHLHRWILLKLRG
ncbi:MAG: ThiF family adenylyltransferase [Anaerolineae bacterium]|nr:ThiF family adenylyltransferase [Anaerolineae bacterium]